MKSLNRTLSLVLVLVMVLGLFGVAGATDFKDNDSIKNQEAVDTMVALNIINGKDGNVFDPAGQVTRGEMAKMICVALNGGKEPILSTTSTPTYSDTKGHWAAGYIEYCTNLGIVAGTGDGTFAPDLAVTGSQAAKMMLVAMNYDADVFGFTGANWEISVNVEANKAKLYKDLSINAGEALSRDNAAQLIYNGVFAQTMQVSWDRDMTTGKVTQGYSLTGNPIVTDKYGLLWTETVLNADGAISYVKNDNEYRYNNFSFDFNGDGDTSDSGETGVNLASSVDYSKFYGMKVKILFTYDNQKSKYVVYDMFPVDSSVILAGVAGQLSDATIADDAESFILGGKTYKFDGTILSTPVYAFNDGAYTAIPAAGIYDAGNNTDGKGGYAVKSSNGTAIPYNSVKDKLMGFLGTTIAAKTACVKNSAAYATYGSAFEQAAYQIKLIDNDNDGEIDCAVVYPVDVQKVTYVNAQTATIGGVSKKLDDVKAYEGIAKGDFVKVTAAANTVDGIVTYEKAPMMQGKITATKEAKATVNGTELGDFCNLQLGASYINMAMVNGFFWFAEMSADAATSGNYAVVTAVAKKPADGSSLNGNQAKIVKANGESETVSTTEDYTAASFSNLYWNTDVSCNKVFVKYSINSDGDYTFTPVASYDVTKDGYTTKGSVAAANYSKTDGKLGDYRIDDGAVIFAITNSGVKVFTGAEFKKVDSVKAGTTVQVVVKKNDSTGFTSVAIAFADVRDVAIGDIQYGYVTGDVGDTLDKKDQTVSTIKVWNGEKEETLTATKNYKSSDVAPAALKKGDFIRYTVDADGLMTIVDEVSAVTGVQFLGTTVNVDKVVGWVDSGKEVEFQTGAFSLKTAVITDDTVIMNVNTAEVVGVPGDSIVLGDTNKNCAFVAHKDGSKVYVDFIVVDTLGNINISGVTPILASPTTAELTTALTNTANAGVVVTGTLPASGVVVPAGKTLNVTTAQLAASLEAITGGTGSKLIVGAQSSDTTANIERNNAGAKLAKFWDDAGTSGGTAGAVATALSGGKVAADTYEWGTVNYDADDTTTSDSTVSAWIHVA